MSGARAGMWEADGAGCKSLPRGLPFPVGVAVYPLNRPIQNLHLNLGSRRVN
jgi:hypothetical protein